MEAICTQFYSYYSYSLSCFSFSFSEEENKIETITYTDANGKVIKTEKMTNSQINAQSTNTKNHYYYDKSGKQLEYEKV